MQAMRSGWRRIPDQVTASSVVAGVGWCFFAAYLVVQARLGRPLVWNDSTIYAAMAHRPLWSRALWAGPRPPLTPLAITVVASPSALVTAQAVVAALAWGVLAVTVGRLVGPGWRRVTAGFLVLGFASTLPIVLWNRSELSESLSLSLMALVFACAIATSRRPTWPRMALTVLACLGFALARDAQVWTVGMLALASGIYALSRIGADRAVAFRAGVLAACLLGVAALAEWGTLASHRTTADTADVLFVRIFPFPGRVAWFAAHGMPEQHRIDRLAEETIAPAGAVKVVGIQPHDPAFAPFERWLRTEGDRTYLLWLATHPGYVVSEPLEQPTRAFDFARGDLLFYAPATHTLRSPLTTVLWPPMLWLVALAAVSLYLGIVTEAWRDRTWFTVVVLVLIGLAAMVVAWHGDGQEVTRHTIEGFAQVRLGLWILFAVGLLGLPVFDPPPARHAMSRGARARRRGPTPAGAGPRPEAVSGTEQPAGP
jgi:hypothetical protein